MKLKDKLSFAKDILKAHWFGYRAPLSVYLILTYACPNSCIYCNYSDLNKINRIGELTLEQISSLIDEMSELGTKKLHLAGGEPMLRKDIGRIIDYAKAKGLFVSAPLSGFQVAERVDELRNIDLVILSFDGAEEVHDYLRGEGSYGRVMGAMDALDKKGIMYWTTTVLTKKNKNSIDFILKLSRDKGFIANFVFVNYIDIDVPLHLPRKDKIAEELVMDDQEMRQVISYLIKKKKEGERVGSSLGYFKYLLTWEGYNTAYKKEPHNNIDCYAGRLFSYILPNGKVYPCGDLYWRREGYDALRFGFKEAFRKAKDIPCHSCRVGCYIEQNLIFSLDITTILNWHRLISF